MFRHPILSPGAYMRLYESGAAGQWRGNEDRRDLQLIRRLIAERPQTHSVLDVGCGTGDFLATLPGTVAKFGIEPSVEAASRAASRGVVIASGSLEELPAGQGFDVITIIDVIEHVPEPASMLQLAAAHLNCGGAIIVSTGDPQSAAWRWFASRFWYATYPEHVSFPSSRFFELWQAGNGEGTIRKFRTSYERLGAPKWLLYGLIQVSYQLSPSLFHRIGRFGGWFARREPKRRFFAPSAPGVFTDHQVLSLQSVSVPARQKRKSA